jgi:hypothetical protein
MRLKHGTVPTLYFFDEKETHSSTVKKDIQVKTDELIM